MAIFTALAEDPNLKGEKDTKRGGDFGARFNSAWNVYEDLSRNNIVISITSGPSRKALISPAGLWCPTELSEQGSEAGDHTPHPPLS